MHRSDLMAYSAWTRRLPVCLLFATALAFPTVLRAEDDSELGKQVFLETAEPPCATCHTLADAGATGDIGPSLDELRPSEERVEEVVRSGGDIMPAFGDVLTEEQIEAVAHYVATVAGQ
jgi:mono/diheme cytochrome c family protein